MTPDRIAALTALLDPSGQPVSGALLMKTRQGLREALADIEAKDAEIQAMRESLIHACDLRIRTRDDEDQIYAIRATANWKGAPFTHDRVQAKYDEITADDAAKLRTEVERLRAALVEACDIANDKRSPADARRARIAELRKELANV